jgi:nucleotide-binding universal stress UspA family protein
MNTTPRTVAREALAPPAGLHEILVPTDLSDHSDAAVRQAGLLAGRLGGRITLYHAVEFPDHEYGHWAFGERPCVWDEQERLARDHLADCAEGLGIPHQLVLERAASPMRALLSRIATTSPDLTVMATLGRGALAHLLLGSVAEQVVERTSQPVLCLRGPQPVDQRLAGRIVLDTDCSDASRPARDMAGLLARSFGGELVVVCTNSTSHPRGSRPHETEPWRPYAEAERWLAPLACDLMVRVVVDPAPTLKAVLRIASEERAGIVITARAAHGRGAGGETARLVRHAHCPVLVV